MRHAMLFAALTMLASPALAEPCKWMPESRIDEAYGDRAPWSTMAGGPGRCKFLSNPHQPAGTISLTQMVKASPEAAADYVRTVGGGMAGSYKVEPAEGIGAEGVVVRQHEADGRILTLIGHKGNIVVMTQMGFLGGVDAAQQAEATKLTQMWFDLDTGGGLVLPTR